jgi:DNA mismatch repair protein MutS2
VAPERLRIEELLAEAEAAERSATEARQAAERERAETQALNDRVRERSDALEDQIDAVRASAAEARELAVAEAERDLAAARAELSALREEIRVARKRERELRRATPAAAARAESDRDRHLDRASTRAERAERSLRTLAQPTQRGPLAVGDPVTEAAIGLRGTIAAIDGDEAEVVGARGQRVRIALARLRPDAHRSETPETATPAVQVIASARSDLSDELDVRGTRAHEAREVVRSFVDDAALAGLPQVRVIHGRGTGAVRTAVRDELDRHPLVERHESESVDGATVVYLGSA